MRPASSFHHPDLGFTRPIARNGYGWWYVDALSSDGAYGLTVIAFIGSVFSPYYAWARRKGRGDPENHCAMNVALYGRDKRRWAMTERPAGALFRDAAGLRIGRSALSCDATSGLTITLDEVSMPWMRAIRGTIRLVPEAVFDTAYRLDAAGQHIWRPIAPLSRVEVQLDAPALRWSGHGYFDSNFGEEPLERAFSTWEWSRTTHPSHADVLYDSRDLTGEQHRLSLRFAADGTVTPFEAERLVGLPKGLWRMPRSTRIAGEGEVGVTRTLEDSPFYTRSQLTTRTAAGEVSAVHESLSLPRFSSPIVQAMLPFRMPRARR